MSKEKFYVPLPGQVTMQKQIQAIVQEGVKQKESFFPFIKSMYKQLGFRHLFSNYAWLVFALFTVIISLISPFFMYGLTKYKMEELYALIFLFSPILYLIFSMYTYMSKVRKTTFEVEMTCKYNVYQIIAFRMFTFSIFSMFTNTFALVVLNIFYEPIDFFRAFMISTTGLFLFSIFFLYALMRNHSFPTIISTVFIWFAGNIVLSSTNNELYLEILMQLPLFIYGLVFVCTALVYVKLLNRLIYFYQKKGVY
ncbi:hypothetical protein [Psychrobacillus sp.]|uniref:hypothetical protein n=1 Tax=Psychrobacillus sp. TaxID=1871623 RepID=UPI0028BF4ACB|nr:hypothetical protein [Psychrobacillus sp.]